MFDYNSENYKKYASKNPLVQFAVSRFLGDLRKLVMEISPKNVLEVGCGEGFTLNYLSQIVGEGNMVGVDIDEKVISKAHQLFPNLEIRRGDAYELNIKTASYDLVLLLEVIEHLKNPKKAIKEAMRVSKRYCIISAPNEPIFRVANLMRARYISNLGSTPGHINNLTEMKFKKLLEECGLKIIKIKRPLLLWNMALCSK